MLFRSSFITIPTILGLNLVLGKGRILYFGQEGAGLIVAYTMTLVWLQTHSLLLLLIFTSIAVVLLSMLFTFLAIRLDDDAFGIMSLALHLIMLALVLNWTSLTRGTLGIPGIQFFSMRLTTLQYVLLSGIVSALWMFLLHRFNQSPYGRALDALAESNVHASSIGIQQVPVTFIAFLFCGLGTLLTQFLFLSYTGLLHPSDYQYPSLVFLILCITAGGPGRIRRVVLATIVLTFLKEGLRFMPLPTGMVGPLRLLLFGFILLIAIYRGRRTLFPERRSL